jgi:hypothetical protein
LNFVIGPRDAAIADAHWEGKQTALQQVVEAAARQATLRKDFTTADEAGGGFAGRSSHCTLLVRRGAELKVGELLLVPEGGHTALCSLLLLCHVEFAVKLELEPLNRSGAIHRLMTVPRSMFLSLVDSQGITFPAITLPANSPDEVGSWDLKGQSRLWTSEKRIENRSKKAQTFALSPLKQKIFDRRVDL